MQHDSLPGDYFDLGNMPDTALEITLSYLKFDNIARLRRVNKRFDLNCRSMLNKGFISVERYHAKCLKEVKTKLPRRESERRDHPLARHNDILTAIETRISLLSMTFMKYVDLGLCCFIPGKVIDEIFCVLRKMKKVDNPSRSCEVLQEFRDISSMAMEYFDEKIVPELKNKIPGYSPVRLTNGSYGYGIFTSGSGFALSMRYSDPVSPPSFPRLCSPVLHSSSDTSVSLAGGRSPRPSLVRDLTASRTPLAGSSKKSGIKTARVLKQLKTKMHDFGRRVDQQNEIINQQNARLAEAEEKLAEMSRRLAENETKFPATATTTKSSTAIITADVSDATAAGDKSLVELDESVDNVVYVKRTSSKRTRSDDSSQEVEIESKRTKRSSVTVPTVPSSVPVVPSSVPVVPSSVQAKPSCTISSKEHIVPY